MLNTALLLTAMAVIWSCSYDKETDFEPDTCDTMEVSFSETVSPIFISNCTPCHGTQSNDAGITLDNYTDAKMAVDGERILGAIKHESGFTAMPRDEPQLDDCFINQIEAWMDQGASNN